MPKFLCIDDAPPESDIIISRLADVGMNIERMAPIALESVLKRIRDGKYDGLILDLVLNEHANNDLQVGYRSNAIARLVRDEAVDLLIRDIPIALWSSNDNFRKFYDRDFSGKDLYDVRYLKDFVVTNPSQVKLELLSICHAYDTIEAMRRNGPQGFVQMLGLTEDDWGSLDSRIGMQLFVEANEPPPAHEFARYIFGKLIDEPFPLVSEKLVAARFGVDIDKSPDWPRVLEGLASSKYSGVYADAWPRWWWDLSEIIGRSWCDGDFRFLAASERVARLRKALGLDGISAAAPIRVGYGTAFWAICEGLDAPVDLENAFVSSNTPVDTWHDQRYISLEAALNRERRNDGLRVHPVDLARFDLTKAAFSDKNAD